MDLNLKYKQIAYSIIAILVVFLVYYLSQKQRFVDVIDKSGLNLAGAYGGISWGDYNNDGYDDLLMRKHTEGYKLFQNNKNETFSDVTSKARITSDSHATTATFGDYNNDGCRDILIGNGFDSEDGTASILYKNNCDGSFEDVTELSGLNETKLHTRGVAWGDYNRDGFVDIYLSTWGEMRFNKSETSWVMTGWDFEPNILYKNNGDGTFSNVSSEAGVLGEPKCSTYKNFITAPKNALEGERFVERDPYPGLKTNWQAVWFDYNNDNWPDLYVSHEVTTNVLYKNNKDGTFTDATEEAGLCQLHSTHGVSIGDYDNDNYQDIFVTGSIRNLFYKNNGDGTFTETSEENNTANFVHLGWGTGSFDYDNDGDLDIYVVNGSSQNTSVKFDYPDRLDTLYKNDGKGIFTNVSKEVGIYGNDFKTFGVFSDFNNDGFTDAFIMTDPNPGIQNEPESLNRLYKNKPNKNNWLAIKLVGVESNRDGVGAQIKIEAEGKKQLREVVSGGSLMSQNSLTTIFGLGDASRVDSMVILWPSGKIQSLQNIEANQHLIIKEE
jgi:hypothetical protein